MLNNAGSRTVLVAASLVLGLAQISLGEAPIGQPKSDASFTIQIGKGGHAVATFDSNLDEIVALALRGPGDGNDIAQILSTGISSDLAEYLQERPASATTRFDVPNLYGRISVKVVLGDPAPEYFFAEFLRASGPPVKMRVVPGADGIGSGSVHFVVDSSSITSESPQFCFTVHANWTPPGYCNISKECCGRVLGACVDCVLCQSTCPPCNMLP